MERTKEILPLAPPPEAVSEEGGFQFQIVADQANHKVVINFGPKPIQWIGMVPADARGLANLLLHVADHAELPIGETPPPIVNQGAPDEPKH